MTSYLLMDRHEGQGSSFFVVLARLPQEAKKLSQFFDDRIGTGQVAGPVSMSAVQPHRPEACTLGPLDVGFRGVSDHHRLACGNRKGVARALEDPGSGL